MLQLEFWTWQIGELKKISNLVEHVTMMVLYCWLAVVWNPNGIVFTWSNFLNKEEGLPKGFLWSFPPSYLLIIIFIYLLLFVYWARTGLQGKDGGVCCW